VPLLYEKLESNFEQRQAEEAAVMRAYYESEVAPQRVVRVKDLIQGTAVVKRAAPPPGSSEP